MSLWAADTIAGPEAEPHAIQKNQEDSIRELLSGSKLRYSTI
jgi:hypothetical protein